MRTRRFSRRIFFAVLAVLLWLGFVVDGSHALFLDQVNLSGNSITSGTADLLISNSQNPSSTVFDKSRAGFAFNLSPGESAQKYFLLKNSSDGDIDFRLSLNAAVSGDDTNFFSSQIGLLFEEVDSDGNPTGLQETTTLSDLRTGGVQTPFIIPKGVTRRYRLTTTLNSSFNTQGITENYDLIFTGTQLVAG